MNLVFVQEKGGKQGAERGTREVLEHKQFPSEIFSSCKSDFTQSILQL